MYVYIQGSCEKIKDPLKTRRADSLPPDTFSASMSLELLLAPPAAPIVKGVQLQCFGAVPVPRGARSLYKFLPEVDMGIVHHMIMYAVSGPQDGGRSREHSGCDKGRILYAWARTGQKTPLGLDFRDVRPSGAAYAVGPHSQIEWLALQIHYQQMSSKVPIDGSGVRLWFDTSPPIEPLELHYMMSIKLLIPPRRFFDEVCALE